MMFAMLAFSRARALAAAGAALLGAVFAVTPALAQAEPPLDVPHAHHAALLQPFPDPPPPGAPAEVAPAVAGAAAGYATWSKIAYQSYRDGNWEIYVADGDGGQAVNVTRHPGADANPDLLLGATRIVFNSDRDGNAEIYSMNPDGTDLRRLTYSTAADYAPAWAPDGKRIAFVSDRSGNLDIWVMDADGRNLARMTNGPEADVSPAWASYDSFYWSHLYGKYNEYGAILKADIRNPGGGTIIRSNLPMLGAVAVANDYNVVIADYDADKDYWNELVEVSSYPGDRIVYDAGQTFVDMHANAVSTDRKWVLATRYEYAVVKNKLVLTATRLERASIPGGPPVQRLAGSGYDASPSWVSADLLAPKVSVATLPKYTAPGSFFLPLEGGDYGPAGVASYDVQVAPPNTGGGMWQDWLVETPAIRQPFYTGSGLGLYRFRARARDAAGNVVDWPYYNVYQAETIVFGSSVGGYVTDNRGIGLPGAQFEGADGAFNPPVAGTNGSYTLYFGNQTSQGLKAVAPGFGTFPAALPGLGVGAAHNFYLPPVDNVIANSGFEVNLDGWTGGAQVGGLVGDGAHSGRGGLALKTNCPNVCLPEPSTTQTRVTVTAGLRNPTLAFFYASTRSNINQVPSVEVRVVDTTTTTVVYTGSSALGWRLGWVDLTPWQGQAITLTFQALPTDDPYPIQLFLDDVAVGSWTTPLIHAVEPAVIPQQWASTEVTVYGGNFQPGTRAYIGATEVSVRVIDGATLALLPPAGLAPGVYDVMVVNPGAQQMRLAAALQLGSALNLPALTKETRP